MSDDLNISNQGQKQGQYKLETPGSITRFKRGRKVGEPILGSFIRLEATLPGTAWVNLEGERLLAELPRDLALLSAKIIVAQGVGARGNGLSADDFPLKIGSPCYFILERLEPEPVLRMLSPEVQEDPAEIKKRLEREAALSAWRAINEMPLSQLASRCSQSRKKLDDMLHAELWPKVLANPEKYREEDMDDRELHQVAYLEYVSSTPETLAAYMDVSQYFSAYARALAPYGILHLGFVPWLVPQARQAELARLETSEGIRFILQVAQPDGQLLQLAGTNDNPESIARKILPAGSPDLPGRLLIVAPEAGGFSAKV